MCVSLYTLCVKLRIVGRIQRDTAINVCRSSRKVPVVLAVLQRYFNFLGRTSKNTQILNFMKIHPV
jgi:hypothetical protein